MRSSNNRRLNDTMLIGPRLQPDLSHILLRWRKHQVVFTADIEKMYRAIELDPRDQQFHRILWRFSNNSPIKEYQLTTCTYGTSAAPYLAIKTIQQLAKDEMINYPRACQIVPTDFYVDDLMSGADDVCTAKELQQELIKLFNSGKFNLRKWSSNRSELLVDIPRECREKDNIEIEAGDTIKTLGIYWCSSTDMFFFKTNTRSYEKETKRTILSDLARIFDPIGFISPITVTAKIILQEVWLEKCGWDEQPGTNILKRWENFKSSLNEIEIIKIPRWMSYSRKSIVELHGFCDSSEKAYAAAVYSRININGDVITRLITSKSRVAPIKMKKTLPRLELCGAALLARLITETQKLLSFEGSKIYCWTDSTITLAWIKGEASKWKKFVSNKVAEIHAAVPQASWYHVRSRENPADVASRGTDPRKLEKHLLWWSGPHWLKLSHDEWPLNTAQYETTMEQKRSNGITALNAISTKSRPEQSILFFIMNKFSSLSMALKVTSWCYRFIENTRLKQQNKTLRKLNYVTADEIEVSLIKIIKLVQLVEFSGEISDLRNNKDVNIKSKILNLDPFCDVNGVLRVGGRLRNSILPYNEKHPIILPPKYNLTELIVNDAHQKTLHSGQQGTHSYIRRKYWILNGKNEVKRVVNKCITCFRFKKTVELQKMGDLPSERVTPSQTFSHAGVDYAGPIQLRTSPGRGHKSYKGYIAVFVCMATKAIHIEVVSNLTTEAFLAAFKRFNSRRGPCVHIYSDNGTTFVGANKIFDRELQLAIKQNLESAKELALCGITWHFIPPGAPHFGGIWEAGVKSIKHHLRRIIGEVTLTYEEMTTVLCQIEGVLNSRPLCQMTADPLDFTAITPAHFLTGRASASPPQPTTQNGEITPSTRWKLVQKLWTDFWNIWSKEYLCRLQQRTKWNTERDNVQIGELVLLKDDNVSPTRWPLGRIIDTSPGKDGKVRVVTVRAKDNTYSRPVTKICKLPMNNECMDTMPKDNISTEAKQLDNEVNKDQQPQRRKSKRNKFNLINTLMLVCLLISPTKCNFTISQLEPGIYVEHLGETYIKRGVFRVQVSVSAVEQKYDEMNVNSTIQHMASLCGKAKELSDEIQCGSWIDHLKIQFTEIISIQKILQEKRRSKRGILGTVLQAVFGVNDEVYRNIDSLSQNQQFIQQSVKDQTKLMITTLATANATDFKVTAKLNAFSGKLNKALAAIERMSRWFRMVDVNKLDIHLLAAHHSSSDYINEIYWKYKNLLNIFFFRQGNLLDFMPTVTFQNITHQAQVKLAPNMDIVSRPLLRMELSHIDDDIIINGYFTIVDIEKFTVIKATSILFQQKEDRFVGLSVTDLIISLKEDSQLYFERSEAEFNQCEKLGKYEFICNPGILYDLKSRPNCILDEVYHWNNQRNCSLIEIRPVNVIWKHLYQTNAWIFIATRPTMVSILCPDVFKETLISGTGLIKISQQCTIKTGFNILRAELQENIVVVAAFTKAVNILNYTTILDHENIPIIMLGEETVFKTSEGFYQQMIGKEDNIMGQFKDHHWKDIVSHPITIGTTSIIIVLVMIVTILVIKGSCSSSTKPSFGLAPIPEDSS